MATTAIAIVRPQPTSAGRLERLLPALTATLAVAAGAIHLVHNYLPMQAPPSGTGSVPAPAVASVSSTAIGPGGLMSLVMPHLSQVMVLNFIAFVGLAVMLVTVARGRSILRAGVDMLLAALGIATLYAWNAMGRANPYGTGTLALAVESALIVLALGDALLVGLRSRARAY
jgi:hypothetical protein